jgi:hypothetical protein
MIGTSSPRTGERAYICRKRLSGRERHTSVQFVDCSMIGMTGSGALKLFRMVSEPWDALSSCVSCATYEGPVMLSEELPVFQVCRTRQKWRKDENLRQQYLITAVGEVHAQSMSIRLSGSGRVIW